MRKTRCKIKRFRITMILVILTIIVVFIILITIEKSIEPKVYDICRYYCKSEISEIVSTSVYEVIDRYKIEYDDISLKVKENGKISSIDIRTENVNKIQSEIIKNINDSFQVNSVNRINIPLGNVSELFFLSGRGPEIEVRFLPELSVTANVQSDFSTAGINQTRHRVYIRIETEAIAVLPTENIKISMTSDCLLAESVFVGDIPDEYMLYKDSE